MGLGVCLALRLTPETNAFIYCHGFHISVASVANSAVEEGSRQLFCLESISTRSVRYAFMERVCVDRLHLDTSYSDASELSTYLDHVDNFK